MTRLPNLGPRGEGWVAAQFALFALIALAGIVRAGDWSGVASGLATLGGLGLVAAGGAIAVAATLALRRAAAFTALPRPREDGALVETGVYRLVRHPIYGGLVLVAAGWALARASIAALLATAALIVLFALKAVREEAWLAERHPGYADYRRRTRRFVPWLF